MAAGAACCAMCPSKNIPLCVPRVFVTARPGRGHFERTPGRAPHARTGTHRAGAAAPGLGRRQRGLRGPGRLRQHLGPHPEKRPGVNSTFHEKRISNLAGFWWWIVCFICFFFGYLTTFLWRNKGIYCKHRIVILVDCHCLRCPVRTRFPPNFLFVCAKKFEFCSHPLF